MKQKLCLRLCILFLGLIFGADLFCQTDKRTVGMGLDNIGDIYRVGTGRVSLEPDHSVFSLTLGGYAAPGEGRFTLTWVDCGIVPDNKKNLFSKTVTHGGCDYTISEDQILYKRNDSKSPWSKIGYKNGFTYTIDIEKIAIIDDRLYALTPEGRHYIAEHKSNKDLYATATAISDGKQTAVLIGLDLTGFDYSMSVKIKNEIHRRNNIPAEAVIINASHTHFTPIVQAWSTWAEFAQKPDSIYLNNIVINNVLKAVDNALADMKQVKINFTRTESHIGHNRALSGPDGLYDPSVDILEFISLDNLNRSIFFSASCHPVFRNAGDECFTISANFPGVAKKILEDQSDITMANFFQGCSGDINPLDGNHVNTGKVLARDVLTAIKGKNEYISGGITCKFDSILVPVHAWDKKKVQEFKTVNSGRPGDLEAEKNVRWADMMLSYYNKGNMPKYMPVYIQTITIGNWKLVGLSREAVTQYSREIKKLWPDKFVTVAGFSNDISSYLPNRAHVRAQNYEGFNSSLWYGQPAFFPENILDLVLDKVKELE